MHRSIIWSTFFFRNMLKKDKSISRYPKFDEWKKRAGLVVPKLI